MALPQINEYQLFETLEKIIKKIDHMGLVLQGKQHEDLKELYAALAQAQAEYRIARPSKQNNDFKMKYETLEDLVRASRPALTKFGLCVDFRQGVTSDGANLLTCILAHSSGQSLESSVRVLPPKSDPRSFVSEVEYLKRMLYAGITGVVADDDDDAEMAMIAHRGEEERGSSLTTKYSPADNARVTITPEQLEQLNYELDGMPDLADKILKQLNLAYLADMPKSKFRDALDRIRQIKTLRQGK